MRKTLLFLALLHTIAAGSAAAQNARPLVREGEVLTFNVRSSRFGQIGTATMSATTDTINGKPCYVLSFDFSARIMLFKVSDKTRSWLDAASGATARYTKAEKSPIGSRREDSRIDVSGGTWTDAAGPHPLASKAPLDELAFIYYVRGAAADIGATASTVERHFDVNRNPVTLVNLGATKVAALSDSLAATRIQMDARDSRSKKGTTRITFYIGADPAHLPLRIDTSMPVGGALTMTLKTVTLNGAVLAVGAANVQQ